MALSEITNYLEDDWDDNSLSSRSSTSEGYFLHPSDGLLANASDVEAGDALKGVYRPEWNVVTGSFSVSNGVVEWDESGGDSSMNTPAELTVGSWEIVQTWTSIGSNNDSTRLNLRDDLTATGNPTNGFQMFVRDDTRLDLNKWDGGSKTGLITASWATDTNTHTFKFSRDTYGNFELFEDGTSKGTATDAFLPDMPILQIDCDGSGGGAVVELDNLVVK